MAEVEERKDSVKKGWLIIECKRCGVKYNIGLSTHEKADAERREEWWAKHIARRHGKAE